MAKDEPPTVKRYKATYSGYYAGQYWETSVVTYGKTRQETLDILDREGYQGQLYEGVFKGGTGRKAPINITAFQRVEQRFVETGRKVIPKKGYIRYKGTPKEHYVRGYTATYITGYYEIPEDEIEHRKDEDLAEWEKS